MKRVVIVTDHYFNDRRGGGISSAVSNLYLHLGFDVNITIISFRNENGKSRSIFFYYELFKFMFLKKNILFYINGIFYFHSNLVPIFLARLSRHKLILSPRGMLKSSALNRSRKKLLFLKFLRCMLKKSTTIHVTDSIEHDESVIYFPGFKYVSILDFPPPRIKEFPERMKESGEINLLYIGRIDELKNLHSVLLVLKDLLIIISKNNLNSKKSIKFTIIGQKSDLKYFDRCKKIIDEIVDLHGITIRHLEFVPYKDLQKYFIDHHVFVSLSKGENFGYTIAEALSCAMPVIITPNSPFGKLTDFEIGTVVRGEDQNKIFDEFFKYTDMGKKEYDSLSKNIFDSYNQMFNTTDLVSEYKKLFNF